MLPSVVDTAVKGRCIDLTVFVGSHGNMSEHWQDTTAFGNGRDPLCGMQPAWHAWLM